MEFDANAHAGGGRAGGVSEWMSERKDAGQWEGLDLEDVGEKQREASEVLVSEALSYYCMGPYTTSVWGLTLLNLEDVGERQRVAVEVLVYGALRY